MLSFVLSSLPLQPGLVDDDEQVPDLQPDDDEDIQPWMIDEEEYEFGGTEDDRLHAQQVTEFVQSLGPVEHEERLACMKASFGIPPEPQRYIYFETLPESTRNQRHTGDLCWHEYHRMSNLSETSLPPMRYSLCNEPPGPDKCLHEPSPILQIFNMKLQTCLEDVTSPVEVYGVFAVRDGEDYCRNYLFNRSRENPLDIRHTGGYIRLLGPKRGMSMKFNCLFEVDLRIKAIGDDRDDKTLVDGCRELTEGQVCYEMLYRYTSSSLYGSLAFDVIIFRDGVEATIQLDFVEVPEDGFHIQMCGYTTIGKHYYAFIDKSCECDSFIRSTGRLPQYFVAAMQMGDYFLVDLMEGKAPLTFRSALHGTDEKYYYFHNGALVSVKVSWSVTF
ncbi:hypothetical protein ACP4OV_020424 [Aristida adscensionis]